MARRWQGWHRFMPLLSGLYVFLVIFPVFAVTQGTSNFTLPVAGWSVPLLLLGLALRAEAGQDTRGAPAN